jgi:serine/threonine protein kinase
MFYVNFHFQIVGNHSRARWRRDPPRRHRICWHFSTAIHLNIKSELNFTMICSRTAFSCVFLAKAVFLLFRFLSVRLLSFSSLNHLNLCNFFFLRIVDTLNALDLGDDELKQLRRFALRFVRDLEATDLEDVELLDLQDLLKNTLQRLQSALPAPAPAIKTAIAAFLVECMAHTQPNMTAADLRSMEHALYAAQHGVIDARLVEIQLANCRNNEFRTAITTLFSHTGDVVDLFLKTERAAVVHEQLKALLVDGGASLDATEFAAKVSAVNVQGVDKAWWYNHIVLYFCCLSKLRAPDADADANESELSLLAAGAPCFFASFVSTVGTTMNQAAFECTDVERLRAANIAPPTVGTAVRQDKKPDIMHRTKSGRHRLFGEVKKPGESGDEDQRRLLCFQLTGALLDAPSSQRATSNTSTISTTTSPPTVATAPAATSSTAPAARAPLARVGASTLNTAVAPQTPSFRGVCRVGAACVQVVGRTALVTLMVQLNNQMCVNLLLSKIDLNTCSMADAAKYSALMIGIHWIDEQQFGAAVGGELFPQDEFVAFANATTFLEPLRGQAPATPSHAPALPPTHGAPQTRSKKKIAHGTIVSNFGERAVVRGAGGELAFKVIAVDASATTAAVDELRVHMQLARLAAPHVVPLVEHFQAPVALPGHVHVRDSIVLVMPWCEPVVANEVRDVREVAQCGYELLGALRALHRLRVLHGDVKWQNALWLRMPNAQRHVVLIDFGLAQQLDADGRATLQRGLGTIGYIAPEVRDGSELFVTAAADVYSAGVALHMLPAHAGCEALQALVTLMRAEEPRKRPSAAEALSIWRRSVTPSLLQQAAAASAAFVMNEVHEPQALLSNLPAAQVLHEPLSVEQVAVLREEQPLVSDAQQVVREPLAVLSSVHAATLREPLSVEQVAVLREEQPLVSDAQQVVREPLAVLSSVHAATLREPLSVEQVAVLREEQPLVSDAQQVVREPLAVLSSVHAATLREPLSVEQVAVLREEQPLVSDAQQVVREPLAVHAVALQEPQPVAQSSVQHVLSVEQAAVSDELDASASALLKKSVPSQPTLRKSSQPALRKKSVPSQAALLVPRSLQSSVLHQQQPTLLGLSRPVVLKAKSAAKQLPVPSDEAGDPMSNAASSIKSKKPKTTFGVDRTNTMPRAGQAKK